MNYCCMQHLDEFHRYKKGKNNIILQKTQTLEFHLYEVQEIVWLIYIWAIGYLGRVSADGIQGKSSAVLESLRIDWAAVSQMYKYIMQKFTALCT